MSELDLKSLLIRVKNKKTDKNYSERLNSRIDKYIITYNKLNNKKYPKTSPNIQRKQKIKTQLKDKIIELSEKTNISKVSYEHFGKIILLMIRSILTKPNFSGYTYKSEFYSDAIYKILKYLHNFDHTLMSARSGIRVNAFAYISQIIHNSIIYIINTKKRENENIKNQISLEIRDHHLPVFDQTNLHESTFEPEIKEDIKEFRILINDGETLLQKIIDLNITGEHKTIVYYPKLYNISMDEYYELRPYLKSLSIVRY